MSLPPGWICAHKNAQNKQKDSHKAENPCVLIVMFEGRHDILVPYDTCDEAEQARYELMETVKSPEFGKIDDRFVKVISGNGEEIEFKARLVAGAFVTKMPSSAIQQQMMQ